MGWAGLVWITGGGRGGPESPKSVTHTAILSTWLPGLPHGTVALWSPERVFQAVRADVRKAWPPELHRVTPPALFGHIRPLASSASRAAGVDFTFHGERPEGMWDEHSGSRRSCGSQCATKVRVPLSAYTPVTLSGL